MGRYAENTTVEVATSQGEIIGMITKRGATDFVSGQMGGKQFVAFVYQGFPVKLTCPAIDPKRCRDAASIEQEKRRQWRVMLLWVKAQLEAIDNGLLAPFAVFMPYMQLKDGRTVTEAAADDGVRDTFSKTLAIGEPSEIRKPALEHKP